MRELALAAALDPAVDEAREAAQADERLAATQPGDALTKGDFAFTEGDEVEARVERLPPPASVT